MTQAVDALGRFVARLTPTGLRVADGLCDLLLASPSGVDPSPAIIALRTACTLRKAQIAARRRKNG